ncbi:sporulation protein YqfC [Heliophilum fasciatum]|uniref:Sporulation protein YqfC n=1 Tax=Heliophilum fasciatum TaxID=35700 RepID=A0A4R2RMN4_9FIRM|nr:sporulation protein YqfC [Heliophilum fasciatum]MCW2278138.1 sporulation protein YqfC [Heliophilum fasciatum]TCP64208.1 sporulation protein YqfC [Heliophilum fasciatum]
MAWERGKLRLQRALSGLLDIPKDVMLDLPKVTLTGNVVMVLENHHGILEYGESRLRILVADGQIEVVGEQLVLKTILPEELVIEGRIAQLNYVR